MERNRLKTGNVNVGCPAVLFLNQDKAGADVEKMTGQCSSLCRFNILDVNMVPAGKELCRNIDRDTVNEFVDGLTIVLLAVWFQCTEVCVMDMEVQCHGRYKAW